MSFEIPEKKDLWNFIIEKGKEIEKVERGKDPINHFSKDDITTIIATMEFFNATPIWMKQTLFDLSIPKFRLFDWLGMCVMSRNNDNRKQNEEALKVLVYAWLKTEGNPVKFIEDLKETDYQIDTSYEKVRIKD